MSKHGIFGTLGQALLLALLSATLFGATGCATALRPEAEAALADRSPEELRMAKAKEAAAERFKTAPLSNDTGMTLVSKVNRDGRYKTSYMIISKAGTVIVLDPYRIPDWVKADLIISTHGDADHNDEAFYGRSAARRSLYTLESFVYKDVSIKGIPSSHQGDDFDPLHPSNVIYVLELDGLRFAIMGDICQTKLTDAQLSAIGPIDIAFMIMFDAPQYGFTVERSQSILAQLKPRLMFPTHNSSRVVNAVGAAMGGILVTDYYYPIDATRLGAGPGQIVLLDKLPD